MCEDGCLLRNIVFVGAYAHVLYTYTRCQVVHYCYFGCDNNQLPLVYCVRARHRGKSREVPRRN